MAGFAKSLMLSGGLVALLSGTAFAQEQTATERAAVAPQSDVAPTAPSRPFGPGVQVALRSDRPRVDGFVAQGATDPDAVRFPDPFRKVGRLPTAVELPPGVYTVLVEGEEIVSGSTTLEVRDRPVTVRASTGSSGLRSLGTLVTALGGAALVAGIVVELSGAQSSDSGRKHKVAIPLMAGGAVFAAGGITMWVVSNTSLEHDGFRVDSDGKPVSERVQSVRLLGRF